MGKNFAKFMATTDKKIVFGDKDVELKLTIPHKVAQQNLEFLTSSLNKEIHVILGDPQMAFDFDEEDDMYKPYTGGRRVIADASGVVTSIQQPEEQKDENQAELFSEETAAEGDASQSEEQTDNPAGDIPAGDDELNDYEKEIMGDGGAEAGSDLPEWMRESSAQQEEGESESGEMNFEGDGSNNSDESQEEGQTAEQAGSAEETVSEIDKDVLESFILSEKPVFGDIPFDFPELLRQRKEEGKTWMDISKETGVTSSQISSKYSAYKKRVAKMMQDGGAA